MTEISDANTVRASNSSQTALSGGWYLAIVLLVRALSTHLDIDAL